MTEGVSPVETGTMCPRSPAIAQSCNLLQHCERHNDSEQPFFSLLGWSDVGAQVTMFKRRIE